MFDNRLNYLFFNAAKRRANSSSALSMLLPLLLVGGGVGFSGRVGLRFGAPGGAFEGISGSSGVSSKSSSSGSGCDGGGGVFFGSRDFGCYHSFV